MSAPSEPKQDPKVVALIGPYETVRRTDPLDDGLGPLLLGTEGFIVGSEPPVRWDAVTGVTVDVLTLEGITLAMLVAETSDPAVVATMAGSMTRSHIEGTAAQVQSCLQRYHLDQGVPSSRWPVVDLAELDRLPEKPSAPLPGPIGARRILEVYGWLIVLLAWSIGGPLLIYVVPLGAGGLVYMAILAGLFILAMIRISQRGRR